MYIWIKTIYPLKMKLMKTISFLICMLFVLNTQGQTLPEVEKQIFTHKNLSIYLLSSSKQLDRQYMTLEDAMKNKKITLHETGSVNALTVDNKSDYYVFIMSGDIVKGGKQDRTIGEDVILSSGAKRIPLTSFCVEQGRWKKRGHENVAEFSTSSQMLSNRNLKVAARSSKNQSAVWSEVSKFQTMTAENINKDVRSGASATSLQLTLEDKDLQKMVKEYISALQPAFSSGKNIVGFAYSINGKISTVEWFGNSGLFIRLQKKLLESAANEAVSSYMNDKSPRNPPSVKEVSDFIIGAGKEKPVEKRTSKITLEKKYEAGKSIMFETFDTSKDNNHPIHVSIYASDDLKFDESAIYQNSGRRVTDQNILLNSVPRNRINR